MTSPPEPADIIRVPVRSSTLASLGYSPSHQILDAEFRTGEIYRFFMVPAAIHAQLNQATSIGAFFNLAIRDRFPFAKLKRGAPSDLELLLERSLAATEPRQ